MSSKVCPKCGRVMSEHEIVCFSCNYKIDGAINQQGWRNESQVNNVRENAIGMRSASTLRVCSTIITVLMIIGAVILFFLYFDEEEVLFLILPIPMIFAAIIQNAFLKGVADIIDNTYEMKLLMRKNLK